MEFVVTSSGVPAGSYRGEFLGAEPYQKNMEKYGEGVLLRWRVIDGPHTGSEATCICSDKLRPKSKLGQFAIAIRGSDITQGERYSFATYVGVRGSLLVETLDSGGTKVSAFYRDSDVTQSSAPVPAPMPSATGQPHPQRF